MRTMKKLLALVMCLCLLASCGAWAEDVEVFVTDEAGIEPEAAPAEADALALEGDLSLLEAGEEAPPTPNAVEEDAVPNATGVKIDVKHFPDATFRAYVKSAFDGDGDGTLSSKEIAAAKRVECYDWITSMKGIEYFTEAIYIYCTGDELKSLDLNKNTKLKELYCYDNWGLKTINISKCINLEILMCDSDPLLTSLDLSHNKNLKKLWCFNCGLKVLDVSKNPKLEMLSCSENMIKSLDISNCANLVKCFKKGQGREGYYTYGSYELSYDSGTKIYTDSVKKVEITNGSKVTMRVDDGLLLSTKLSPAASTSALTWKTSNSKVATVSENGVVIAKKKGTAKITATAANGKKDTIKITVKAKKSRTELSGYMGKKIDKIKKKFGLKYEGKQECYGMGEYQGVYESAELRVHTYIPGDLITCIEIKKGTKYSLGGIYLGMNLKTARSKALKYVKKHYGTKLDKGRDKITDKTLDFNYGKDDLFLSDYPGFMFDISVTGKKGAVTNIYFEEGDLDIN